MLQPMPGQLERCANFARSDVVILVVRIYYLYVYRYIHIQVEPGKPGAEVSTGKLPICQKNKLAYRNVSALRPCYTRMYIYTL